MTDYTKSTGSSGTMLIRDTGTKIQFWLKAGSQTYNHQLPWGWTVNGVTDNTNLFDFQAGGDWQKLREWTVSTSQTVTFRLFDTGTAGLGGPTTFSKAISRATVPPAPTTPVLSQITGSSIFANSDSNGNGGSSLTRVQFGYGTSTAGPSLYKDGNLSNGTVTLTGLAQGTTYYVWCRVQNALGWSAWSGRSSAKTLATPAAPGAVSLSGATQTSVVATFSDNQTGGAPITARQIGYGTSSSAPTDTATYSGPTTITGLQPATTYYFWARCQNSVGWGPWTATPTAGKTIAGARYKVGAVWKDAVPYVRVAGVWKLARPWAKVSGVWRESR